MLRGLLRLPITKNKGINLSMKTIVILADTLCRRYLPVYEKSAVTLTENINRIAERSTVFDQHWCGSSPCMPARRDMFTGRVNFLERNWCGAEPFDHLLPEVLRDHNIYCHMVTDHSNYHFIGGEGYINAFNSWEVIRGQEKDPVGGDVIDPTLPPHVGRMDAQHLKNLKLICNEADYPTPTTLAHAATWLEQNSDADNYMLWVECFDPHEPFDTPQKYLELYDNEYDGDSFYWPEYQKKDYTEEQKRHIRKRYMAKLTMMDHWLGKILDVLDQNNAWDDTMVIFTTDHRFMLGEHGFYGKNYMPAYNEVFHIPFMIHMPGQFESRRCNALTQNIDLFPTILEQFGISSNEALNKIHGKSLLPLLRGECDSVRDSAIFGNFGLSVNLTDGKYTYFRAAKDDTNMPLYVYGVTPGTIIQRYGIHTIDDLSSIETGRFLSWTKYPVLKIPANHIRLKNVFQTFDKRNPYNAKSMLFDIAHDYAQEHPISDDKLEKKYCDMLSRQMAEHDSPAEQWERLGMKRADL